MPEQALIELLRGKGAHTDPVACIEDVSWELAARKIAAAPHTIWQIVSHMNYWMDYELRRVRAEPLPYPAHAAESWSARSAPADEADWKGTVSQFASLIDALTSLAMSGPEELARPVAATHEVHNKLASSLLAVLWQMAVHNSYHVGQIAMLRRMVGAWPPRGGGDSW